MGRMLAVTSREFRTPATVLRGLQAMQEGYDGSGVGILLRDLGGPFAAMKDAPVLSGIFTDSGLKRMDRFMLNHGFSTKYKVSFKRPQAPPAGTPQRQKYLIRAYDYPTDWEKYSREEIRQKLTVTRMRIRQMGDEHNDMVVFSFWPDTIMFKEMGDPMAVAEYLQLDRKEVSARVIMVQGRQSTVKCKDLYSCHPFFLQGFSTMANGENTALAANRSFMATRGFQGYNGLSSDAEVFTHALHYTVEKLGLGLDGFKHVITPLSGELLGQHKQTDLLKHVKYACRQLIIDGPICIIGSLPDNTIFMVQDRKKLRPGVVGGQPGVFAFSSEVCGLEALLPDRDRSLDFQPMHLDTAVVSPDRQHVNIFRQTDAIDFPERSPLQ